MYLSDPMLDPAFRKYVEAAEVKTYNGTPFSIGGSLPFGTPATGGATPVGAGTTPMMGGTLGTAKGGGTAANPTFNVQSDKVQSGFDAAANGALGAGKGSGMAVAPTAIPTQPQNTGATTGASGLADMVSKPAVPFAPNVSSAPSPVPEQKTPSALLSLLAPKPVSGDPFASSEISSTGVPYNEMVFSRDMNVSSVKNAQDREFLGLPPLPSASATEQTGFDANGALGRLGGTAPKLTERGTYFNESGVEMIQPVGLGGAKPIPYEEFKAKEEGRPAAMEAERAKILSSQLDQANSLNPRLGQADSINFGLNQSAQTSQQPGFNVNQAAAGSLQGAIGATQQAMQGPLNVGAYANPYTSAVIDRTQQDIERQRQMAQNTLGAQATAAKAFGGSRQGVAEGVMAGEYGRISGDIAAQQRQANYNQALQAAMSDRQARLGAASQLGGLGQQAFSTGQTIQQNQMQQGLLQQGIQQALIDAAKAQYGGYTGAPTSALQAPLAALGVTPTPQTTTNSTQPGLFNYLQLGANVMG